MKILIPLTILVLSFIIYYFFNTSTHSASEEVSPVDTQTLTLEKKKEVITDNYISHLAKVQPAPRKVQQSHNDKIYLSLDDLRNGTLLNNTKATHNKVSQKRKPLKLPHLNMEKIRK